MKLSEIIQGIDVRTVHADLDTEIVSLTADSRRATRGSLFVAVRGFHSDGHDFIPMAAAMGCGAVICESLPEVSVPYVLVRDSRKAMALAACNYYRNPSREMKVIGITGTNGKTTTSVLVKQLLEKCLGAKVGLVGSICNMVGDESYRAEFTTPESYDLQRLFRTMADSGCTHCVMEKSPT